MTEGYAVHVDGVQHTGGAEVHVDHDTAQRWIRHGWVSLVPAKTSRSRARKEQ
ncbi:hypothetical protein [Kineococcus gypseus]|uniref:hypothetical protein n=1 Tax=Kineococcus gypseus TaxID=1637102 RepID=UPI003D7D14EB